MNYTESFIILGIDITKDERAIRNAYRQKLTVTNPEDNPEGFKRLRSAYDTACKYAKEPEEAPEEKPRDTTPSGLWLEKAVEIYRNIRTRQDVECWKALFNEDVFFSIEEEENCRMKLLGYLTEHFKLPTAVWKLFDQKLSIVSDAKTLREKFPLNFVHYIVGRCERGEDLEFSQFEGAEDADYDLFLEYYDRCWQALQEKNLEEAENCVRSADALGIRHPVMEISRANVLARKGLMEARKPMEGEQSGEGKPSEGEQSGGGKLSEGEQSGEGKSSEGEPSRGGKPSEGEPSGGGKPSEGEALSGEAKEYIEEAVRIMESEREKYPGDAMICYNFAELLWMTGGAENGEDNGYRSRAAGLYEELKADNDAHYMANIRLTEWYYTQKQYRKAKKCAEKVLASGSDDAFLDLLARINEEIEKELEVSCRENPGWEPRLELCWCYLQDGKIARGIQLAGKLEKLLPPEKEAEYKGLLSKLYVEQGEYEEAIAQTFQWEAALEEKLKNRQKPDEKEEKRDRDRLRQAHLIRMQCYHNLGFREKEKFTLAVREGESILAGTVKDVGILLEIAQIYSEMDEYELCQETAARLVDEYQIFAAYASSMEAYRRQLNAGGVVRTASICLRYFPNYAKAYEYLAKVYLDLRRREDLEKVLADAEKNGVRSPILEAYAFQMDHEVIDIGTLNVRLKNFRDVFFKQVEKGDRSFYEKGLPILTEYLYYYPDDFMLVERAIFHRAAHHLEEARADFEKALYLNPVNPYALNGLSFVYKYQGDYEKALFFMKKAILYMDQEMSPVIYADMGNLYALLGICDKAVEAYRKYESLAGENRSNWFGDNLAEFYLRMGQIGEAEAVYGKYYKKNKWLRYEKLVGLYNAAGDREKARRTIGEWGWELHSGNIRRVVKGVLAPAVQSKPEVVSYPDYYCSKGWVELLFGKKSAALAAFDKMFRNGLVESSMEGKICDAVFACILCGDEKRGRKYARRLQEWLKVEQAAGKPKYYNREKAHLQMEFLAAYYTEDTEKLQEILDRESKCEICHFCNHPRCREMEGVRILFLLRMGRREEARERLRRNLEVQPWDEYMLAVRHVAFQDVC
ncbi:MAG TPA: hypothetical protein DCZ91_05295 [Lachnospiraceae bacterium]|nr:hypothetical protein [Lachnospiraceae bacterium]